MQKVTSKVLLWCGVILFFAAIAGAFLTGYGTRWEVAGYNSHIALQQKEYPAEHLDVIYQREVGDVEDWLHLEVDTLYQKRGRGAYAIEVVCKREFNVRHFDKGYSASPIEPEEFLVAENEGNDEIVIGLVESRYTHQRRIVNFECQGEIEYRPDGCYEVWHTKQLPHIADGAKALDPYSGIIMEVRSRDNSYHLRAQYTAQS